MDKYKLSTKGMDKLEEIKMLLLIHKYLEESHQCLEQFQEEANLLERFHGTPYAEVNTPVRCHGGPRDNPCVEEGTPERGHGASPCDSPCVEVGSAGIPRGVHHDPCEEGGIPSPHGTPHVGVDNAGRSHDCLHDNLEVLEAFLHCNLGALEVCRRDTTEVLEVCRHGRMAVLEGHIQV